MVKIKLFSSFHSDFPVICKQYKFFFRKKKLRIWFFFFFNFIERKEIRISLLPLSFFIPLWVWLQNPAPRFYNIFHLLFCSQMLACWLITAGALLLLSPSPSVLTCLDLPYFKFFTSNAIHTYSLALELLHGKYVSCEGANFEVALAANSCHSVS